MPPQIPRAGDGTAPVIHRPPDGVDAAKSAEPQNKTTEQQKSSSDTGTSYRATPKEAANRKAEKAAEGVYQQTTLNMKVPTAQPKSVNAVQPEMMLPGRMITVSIYDANHKFIASKTEPLYDDVDTDMFHGEINGNKVNWNEGNVKVEVNERIGTKLDKDGRPTGGVPVETWAAQAGKGRAKYVLVEIENARIPKDNKEATGPDLSDDAPNQKTGGSKDSKNSTTGRPAEVQGTGTSGTTQGTPGGTTSTGGGTTGTSGTGSTNKGDSKETKETGRDAGKVQDGKKGGGTTGSERGKVGGHKEGGVHGKRDGTRENVDYFYDPDKAKGQGTQNTAPPGATKEGMAGGDGKAGDKGVPAGSGILKKLEIPAKAAPAVAIAMILADANITSLGDDIVKMSVKLGKKAAGKGGGLSTTVAGKMNRFVDGETKKITDALAKEPKFTKLPKVEQEKIAKELREEIAEDANRKVRAKLDDRIKEHTGYVEKAKDYEARTGTKPNKIAQDAMNEDLEIIEAAKRAKDTIPEPKVKHASPDEVIPNKQIRPDKHNPNDPKVSPKKEWSEIANEPANPLRPNGPKLREEVSNVLDDLQQARRGDQAARNRINNRNPHPMTANDEGWTSLDIGGRHQKYRLLYKENSDGTISWKVKDTHQ